MRITVLETTRIRTQIPHFSSGFGLFSNHLLPSIGNGWKKKERRVEHEFVIPVSYYPQSLTAVLTLSLFTPEKGFTL